MNTRMFWTPNAWWFGGGSDLNPCIEYAEDTAHFHATQRAHLDPHGPEHYPRLKAWRMSISTSRTGTARAGSRYFHG